MKVLNGQADAEVWNRDIIAIWHHTEVITRSPTEAPW